MSLCLQSVSPISELGTVAISPPRGWRAGLFFAFLASCVPADRSRPLTGTSARLIRKPSIRSMTQRGSKNYWPSVQFLSPRGHCTFETRMKMENWKVGGQRQRPLVRRGGRSGRGPRKIKCEKPGPRPMQTARRTGHPQLLTDRSSWGFVSKQPEAFHQNRGPFAQYAFTIPELGSSRITFPIEELPRNRFSPRPTPRGAVNDPSVDN